MPVLFFLLSSEFHQAHTMGLRTLLKKLEVKPTDDEFEAMPTTRWGNKDVYPIPHDKRTYGVLAFYAYWGTCGVSLSSWTIGSSLVGIGLTAGQACGAVVCRASGQQESALITVIEWRLT